MNMGNAAAWVTIIAASAAAVVSILNAWNGSTGRQEARDAATSASGKLDTIHELTNSNMAALKLQLATALGRIDALENKLLANGKSIT
jgi:hypothetical protein